MMLFDAFIRFSGLAILTLMAFLALRDVRTFRPGQYLLALSISVSGMLLSYTPETLQVPEFITVMARIVDIPSAVLVWLFGLSLFDDA